MGRRKDKDQSLIICKDGDFKRRISGLLLDAAFPSEKHTVSTVSGAREKFGFNKDVVNIIINGADFPGEKVNEFIKEMLSSLESRECKMLAYLEDDQYENRGDLEETMPDKLYFFRLPVSKKDINNVFNPIPFSFGARASKIPPRRGQAAPAAEQPKDTKNLNFFETTLHVKDTIGHLSRLKSDRSDLVGLGEIGQRFNGIFGAFSFVDKTGYQELCDLSHIVDDVSRHYTTGEGGEEITEEHYDLVLECAKCVFLLLKDLRDSNPLDPKQLETHKALVAKFEQYPEVKRRSAFDQSAVDDLMEQAMAELEGEDEGDESA